MVASIWEFLESTTSGLMEAVAIRVALHLGKGRPALARLSAHKALLYSFLIACVTSIFVCIIGETVPLWFTDVEIIQDMIFETIPIMAVGNVFLVYGTCAWGIISGQGRYALGTKADIICSIFIMMPFCAVSVYVFNYNLEGIICGIIVACMTECFVMSYHVLLTDWNSISEQVMEQNEIQN
mmetsp:Transcript_11074/g.24422  ORF Transcript_11074/g.24422 Transcript_11074/m.24422 type:complete len:182 (+) Transcript_11074:2144-2689(+)